MNLALIHQAPSNDTLPGGAVVWRTCLREVVFLPETPDVLPRTIIGGDAYALLVEIVSGLRSPLVGETEVQSQFKAFLSSLDPETHRPLVRLGQRILRDAKVIRRNHLQGLGAHSYGRLAARHISRGARVALVGAGALAAQVIEALDDGFVVDQWARTDRRTSGNGARARFALLSSAAGRGIVTEETAVLVVAAPVSRADLEAVIACYPGLESVVDLRGERDRTFLTVGPAVRIATLDDLFADAAPDSAAVQRVRGARADIAKLGDAYDRQEELHPFGWDDLCA